MPNAGQVPAAELSLNPLPRSIMRKREYVLLDGEWRFDLDPLDVGLRDHWFLGHEYGGTAHWPGTIEDQLANAQQAQVSPWQDRVIAWYEREFTIPEPWCALPGCMIQVTFGACSYETRVWLNGHLLETLGGHDSHEGGFTSFSYELPAAYLLPTNRLTVRISHSLDAEIPRGKQESRVFKRGGIWYQTISGPVRSIWIEPIERNRLRSRLGVLSQVEDRVVEINVTTRICDPGIYQLRLAVLEEGTSQLLQAAQFQLPLEAGEKRQWLPMAAPGALPWSPGQPNLYHLTAQLIAPDGNVSQIETHFGMRKIEARDQRVLLNNQPIYLDGILYQPGRSTYEEIKQHILAIKALGCNLVRVHIAGVDPRIYDLADEIGILLWVEVPSPHSSSHRSRTNHRAELGRMLMTVGTHPSVIILSLYNEDWGAQDIATSRETRDYIAQTYDWVHLHWPQLLVVDNDGWHHVSVEGRLKTDLLTAHLYVPEMERWRDQLDRLMQGDLGRVTAQPLVVGDPFFFRGQAPAVVSEWGGFGFPVYGGPQELAARAERIGAFKHELHACGVVGDVYTQAISIEQEVNGLIDAQTGNLLVPPGLLGPEPDQG